MTLQHTKTYQQNTLNTQTLNLGLIEYVFELEIYIIRLGKYNRDKTKYYKNLLKTVSKNYKRTFAMQHKKHNDLKICRLRNLKRKQPCGILVSFKFN